MAFRIPRRRWILLVLLLVVAFCGLFLRPSFYLARTAISDRDERRPLPTGYADDASRLNATQISQIWDMPQDDAQAEHQLRSLLAKAKQDGLHVSIAGARHSMGGQTIYPGGIQINMLPYHRLELDESQDLLFVQAGALWSEVVPYLDQYGRSVAVMQSNNSFSVGGSLSVNCHGWQPNRPPIASTVESFHLMLADGTIVHCSRTENSDLFAAVLGGYGLFGIILDAQLHVVPNVRCRVRQYDVPADQFVAAWDEHMWQSPDVEMAFGRLSVTTDNFLKEALLYVFTRDSNPPDKLSGTTEPARQKIARLIFRNSVNSNYGKQMRWWLERNVMTYITGQYFSRNELLSTPAEMFENRSATSTDILHEYFVPWEHLNDFLAQLWNIIPASGGNLLNVTLRDVREDHDCLLRYADHDMVALVMLFNQKIDRESDSQMANMTQQMIAAALKCGGRYYLPYRLQATKEQFEQAYPQSTKFFELKRRYDPDGLFQNQFYAEYGLNSISAPAAPN